MATYVLVHGAWHAKWVWDTTLNLFPKASQVFTIDLSGHGTNKKAFASINLKSYTDELVSFIRPLNQKVILVGHSLAGVIISQIAEEISDCIERLIYLAAFVPAHAESVMDIAQKFQSPGISTEMIWDKDNMAIHLRRENILRNTFYNACTYEQAMHAMELLGAEPMRPYFDSVVLSAENFGKVPKRYIECLQDKAISIEDQKLMQKKIECDVISLHTADHSPFFSSPKELVEALIF